MKPINSSASGKIKDKTKKIEEDVINSIEHLICPILEKLRRKGTSLDRRNIDLLQQSLLEITKGFGRRILDKRWKLSAREIEICHMIKSGLTTKEIADLLCSSVRTIEHHRNHIRKKIGISQKNVDLTVYLRSFS